MIPFTIQTPIFATTDHIIFTPAGRYPMHEEDWRSDEAREMDLRIENEGLREEISLKGGRFWKGEEVEPEVENGFLKSVMAFEEASEMPAVVVRSLFPEDFHFPPVSSMTPEQISRKLGEIEEILGRHNIAFGFANDLPPHLLYTHLVEDYIPNERVTAATGAGFTWNIDGCDGDCESCFQRDYCATGKEILEEVRKKRRE
jgi:hypothetical protein